MGLLISTYYPVGPSDSSLFVVSAGDGKIGIGPSTTERTSHKVGCCIDGIDYSSMSHLYKHMY